MKKNKWLKEIDLHRELLSRGWELFYADEKGVVAVYRFEFFGWIKRRAFVFEEMLEVENPSEFAEQLTREVVNELNGYRWLEKEIREIIPDGECNEHLRDTHWIPELIKLFRAYAGSI